MIAALSPGSGGSSAPRLRTVIVGDTSVASHYTKTAIDEDLGTVRGRFTLPVSSCPPLQAID